MRGGCRSVRRAGSRSAAEEGAFEGETELRRGLHDRLESDEGPGDHGQDAEDLEQYGVAGRKRGPHGRQAALMMQRRRHEAGQDARDQHKGEKGVEPYGELFAEDANPAAEHDRCEAQQDFAEIHVESDHRVMESELKRIAEKITRQQDQRRRIRLQDRDIGQKQEPSHEEPVVVAEHFRDKSVGPAGTPYARRHLIMSGKRISGTSIRCLSPSRQADLVLEYYSVINMQRFVLSRLE